MILVFSVLLSLEITHPKAITYITILFCISQARYLKVMLNFSTNVFRRDCTEHFLKLGNTDGNLSIWDRIYGHPIVIRAASMAMWTSFWLIVKVVTWDAVTKLAYQLVPIYHNPEIVQKLVSVVLATGNLFLQACFQSLSCGFYDSSNLASAHCQSVVYYSVWIIYYRSSEILFWMCNVSFLHAFRCKNEGLMITFHQAKWNVQSNLGI